MKKFFSLFFASLILLAGMHFSVATHTCCGELAAVKYSLTGEKANCGMEQDQTSAPQNGLIRTNCCKNLVASCSSDQNFFSSTTFLKDLPGITAPLFAVSQVLLLPSPALSKPGHSMVGPPVRNRFNFVDQAVICVFII